MNYAKTAILLAAMTALFLVIGYMLAGLGGAAIAFVIALAMNGYAFWNSDKMALRMHNAEPVTRSGAPELYDMVERLAQNAQMPTPAIYIIHSDQPNAFATGRNPENAAVAATTGIMKLLSTEELAGVMAHEIAHVTQRHIARTQDGVSGATLATWAGVLLAILAGSADADVVLGALSLGQAINVQRQINYTRNHELEADRLGIQTLAGAGYDPQGVVNFFSTLEQQTRLYGSGMPEILRTHPLNTRRIAEARARAARPKASSPARTSSTINSDRSAVSAHSTMTPFPLSMPTGQGATFPWR